MSELAWRNTLHVGHQRIRPKGFWKKNRYFLVLLKRGLLWKGRNCNYGLICNYLTWAEGSNRRQNLLAWLLSRKMPSQWEDLEVTDKPWKIKKEKRSTSSALYSGFGAPNKNIWAMLSLMGISERNICFPEDRVAEGWPTPLAELLPCSLEAWKLRELLGGFWDKGRGSHPTFKAYWVTRAIKTLFWVQKSTVWTARALDYVSAKR